MTDIINNPIRILHVFGNLNLGGAESRTVDLYKRIDRKRVQFDFLVHTDEPSFYDDTVRAMGARIFRIPRFKGTNISSYKKAVRAFFREHEGEWSMVHGHMTSTAAIYLAAAKETGVSVTIAHARSAGVDPGIKGIATRILRLPLRGRVVDKRFACTRQAAVSVFGRRLTDKGLVEIIPNAVDLAKYGCDDMTRQAVRAEFGIPEDAIVIGHVGSFRFAKNHEYLLRVFSEYRKKDTKAVLLLVGDGSLFGQMKELARSMGLSDSVIFAGSRSDVADCLQAMDVFVFPSRYEGLPGSVIEAQASLLPCLISDRIPVEVDVTELVERRSIDEDPSVWAERIHELVRPERSPETLRSIHDRLKIAGYDAAEQAVRLNRFYLSDGSKDER